MNHFITAAPAEALPSTTAVGAPVSDGLLVNVFDDLGGGGALAAPSVSVDISQDVTPGAEEGFMKFLFKNNGVLFENEILQIGIKSEYKKNLGMFIAVCVYNLRLETKMSQIHSASQQHII